jgi:hypothetical protein
MTFLARAVAEDCDAPPVLVIFSPFEQQRVGNYLLDAGFLPLLLDDPSLGLEFVTAFDGQIAAVLLGGTFAVMSVEAFCTVLADAYPYIPVVVVSEEGSNVNGLHRLSLHQPLTRDTVVQAIYDAVTMPLSSTQNPPPNLP